MGFFSNLFKHKEQEPKAGGMEDFMLLIRVYYQAVMAAQEINTNTSPTSMLTVSNDLENPAINLSIGSWSMACGQAHGKS